MRQGGNVRNKRDEGWGEDSKEGKQPMSVALVKYPPPPRRIPYVLFPPTGEYD